MFDPDPPHFSMWLMTSLWRSPRCVLSWLSWDFMSWISNWICLIAMKSCRNVGVVPSSASTERNQIHCFEISKLSWHRIKSVFDVYFIFFPQRLSNQIRFTRETAKDFKLIYRNYFLSSLRLFVWKVRKNTRIILIIVSFHHQHFLLYKVFHSTSVFLSFLHWLQWLGSD